MANRAVSDPELEALVNKSPLMLFSIYTHGQSVAVRELGDEIINLLRPNAHTAEGGAAIEGSNFLRAYNLFWFWVLGAYEVLRTMDDHPTCFAPDLAHGIMRLKQQLAVVRIPFAKQELRNHGGPVHGELSVAGFRPRGRMSLHFDIEGNTHDAVAIITSVKQFFDGIDRAAIIGSLPRRRRSRK